MSTAKEAARLVAQMFCVGFEGISVTPGIRSFLKDRNGSGYILFRRNIESPQQLRALNEELWDLGGEQPIFSMVDQEGGSVMRLGGFGTEVPPMGEVGRLGSRRIARSVGRLLGREIRSVGFNVNCAPVLDVNSNPDNPIIGDRAFSSDPEEVGSLGAALIKGLHEAGVLACAKHFPGHGDTRQDSHLHLPILDHDRKRLDEVELVPFQHVFRDQPPALLMTAHVLFKAVDPERPATLSPRILQGILRQDLGYDGVIVSDDIEMSALADRYSVEEIVQMGLEAGVDLFLVCQEEERWLAALDEAERLVLDGVVKPERIFQSTRRIARAKTFLHASSIPTEAEMSAALRSPEHLALISKLA